jgi:hypothetical protein
MARHEFRLFGVEVSEESTEAGGARRELRRGRPSESQSEIPTKLRLTFEAERISHLFDAARFGQHLPGTLQSLLAQPLVWVAIHSGSKQPAELP